MQGITQEVTKAVSLVEKADILPGVLSPLQTKHITLLISHLVDVSKLFIKS